MSCPRAETIVAEGDRLGEMYVVVSGTAEVVVSADEPRNEQIVALIRPGETIGEMSMVTHEPTSATVRAADEVELLVLHEPDLEQLVTLAPQIQRNIVSILSARLAHMNKLAAGAEEQRGRIVFIERYDGEEELVGAALAGSIAWHTRAPTVHVAVGDGEAPRLTRLATMPAVASFRVTRSPGADFLFARPGARSSRAASSRR